ncbi:MAG: 1-(5-phosphoribosyl)-5-[(5-phosphoribosylamino)methylideneamino]imidazole-4-carboxamide isomerase [Pseudomonadota bacterium]
MILYPAIDLKQGRCVRLLRGDMDQATVYNDDPGDQARRFVEAGCEWLHVVDLDGAFAGRPENAAAVSSILEASTVPVQLGGGVRNLETVSAWIERGVSRVILGTAAVKDPDLLRRAADAYPGRIALGLDARGGRVAVSGWAEDSGLEAVAFAKQFDDLDLAAVIFTDVDRDGALEGPNLASTDALARALRTPVIASGGVSSLEDLRRIKALAAAGVAGAISGRAIYDGRIDLADALSLFSDPAPC